MNDEKAIRALIDTWISATKAGDTDTVLDLMTDDVVFMVPGQKPFGKDVFRESSLKMGKGGVHFNGETKVEELKVFGNWGYARVYLKITMTPPGADTLHLSGYTLSIYRKESNGKWRLCRDANMVGKDK